MSRVTRVMRLIVRVGIAQEKNLIRVHAVHAGG
jgi:hypothetical protein